MLERGEQAGDSLLFRAWRLFASYRLFAAKRKQRFAQLLGAWVLAPPLTRGKEEFRQGGENMIMPARAGQGMAWLGMAGCGVVRRGQAGLGSWPTKRAAWL